MKKLGIYGGTFSPIHNGHINAARNFYDKAGLDELLIMPAYLPPHKQIDDGCTANERLEMARLAFEDEKRNIKVSDYEITQGGKSYTYLTLRHFTSDDVKLVFLTGTDMFLTLDEWKNPAEVMSLAEIALIRREDSTPELDRKIAEKEAKYKKEFSAQILHIDAPTVEISSTEVRELAGKGEKISGLVPEKVASYIAENKLYVKKHSRDEIRKEIKEYVGEKRYPHILGTEKECLRLAGIFGLDGETTEKLAVAALLHDITKILKPSEHISYMAGIGREIPKENLDSAKTLHALTGAYRARELYPDEVDDTVFSAIKYHTTGKADMTLTEKLMYLADYIEPTRTFPECVALREYFDEAIKAESVDDALRDTLIRSFDMTVGELEKDGAPIHPDTLAAREYLINEKNVIEEKNMNEMKIQPKELAEKAVKILDMHKAANIKLLRTEEKTVLADYFVICTASSNTQVRGFMNELEYKLGLEGIKPLRVEGYDSALWILADYGSVIVHIFNSEQRQFYNLEKLWREAEEIDISSLLTEN